MPNKPRGPIAAALLMLVAAALACSPAARATATPSLALTQAASTLTAAANIVATSRAAPTLAPTDTPPAATATTAPTQAPSATAVPTEAATATAASTAETAASATPAASGQAVTLDPCTLITADDGQAIFGVAMGKPKGQQGGCSIADAAVGISDVIGVYALPASQVAFFFTNYVSQLQQLGIKVDPTQLNSDVAKGDMVASVNDLITITAGQSAFSAKKLDGVGDTAIWSWNTAKPYEEAILVTARPGAMVALLAAGPTTLKEDAVQAGLVKVANRILGGLPDNFIVAGLQQPSAGGPALDPCTLITTADATALLGSAAGAGSNGNGLCTYQAAASQKLLVRVFAFDSGASIQSALSGAMLQILVGDTVATNKVTADIAAGDWVAALNDMAASTQGLTGRTLKKLDGVGDAALFSAEPVGGTQIVYALAAQKDVVTGIEMELIVGDPAATEKLVVPLLQGILAKLPPNFTVPGAP